MAASDGSEDEWEQHYANRTMDALHTPSEDHLMKVQLFVQEHKQKLHEIEKALSTSYGDIPDTEADPISVHLHAKEKMQVQELIQTDNEEFNKIVIILSYLCDEIHEMKETAEEEFYRGIAVFGHVAGEDEDVTDWRNGKAEVIMGRSIKFFQEISNFVDHANALCVNMVHQLASLYSDQFRTIFKQVLLMRCVHSLGDLLAVLVTLDALIADNDKLAVCWNHYLRMMDLVRKDASRYGTSDATVEEMDKMLLHLKEVIFPGEIFTLCIEQDFDNANDRGVLVRSNRTFQSRFALCISLYFKECSEGIGSSLEVYERKNLVGVFALYALSQRFTGARARIDEKFYKVMWEIQRRVPMVTLCGKSVWFPADFLEKYVSPRKIKGLSPKPAELTQFRVRFLKEMDAQFPARVNILHLTTAVWMVRVESMLTVEVRPTQPFVPRFIRAQAKLLHRGVVLAALIKTEVTTVINMHLALQQVLHARLLKPIAQCVELLKAIEGMFRRKETVFVQLMAHISTIECRDLHKLLSPVTTKLKALRSQDVFSLDIIAAINLISTLTRSSQSINPTRMIILHMCFDILKTGAVQKVMRSTELQRLKQLRWQLDLESDWQHKVFTMCSCSFLYWRQEFAELLLSGCFKDPSRSGQIQYLLAGFADGITVTRQAQHVADDDESLNREYEKFVQEALANSIIAPLCNEIDRTLRLRIHSVKLTSMETPNPKTSSYRARAPLLALTGLRVFDKIINLKRHVEHYLDRTFYNLTTVALHDWQTYGEMKNLAKEMYGLALTDSHLPMGTLNQGLDILQIMRNIDVFVERYNYNINEQVFVERAPEGGARHLNCINIHSISASIRTHGPGIMDTTVNYTYQFLSQKFTIFSQFLYDSYIKSNLSRERRWYRKNKDLPEIDNQFPYERAVGFNKDIKKLGVEDGLTYIDQFRLLITEIGNALGFVRMVRSAGLHYVSNAIKFVPDLNRIIDFEKWAGEGGERDEADVMPKRRNDDDDDEEDADDTVEGAHLSAATIAAASNLDNVLANLSSNFAEGTDYLKILLSQFQKVLLGDEDGQKHLRNFYMIVPSLILNFCDKIRHAKTQIMKMRGSHLRHGRKKSKAGLQAAFFTDDGFAIGVAFILASLKQNEEFDSLHFFRSVNKNFGKIADDIKRMKALRVRDADQDDEIRFKTNRLADDRRELELCYFSFSGARIFFAEGDDEEEEDDDEADAPAGAPAASQATSAPPPPAPAPAGSAAPPPPGAAPPPPPPPPPPF